MSKSIWKTGTPKKSGEYAIVSRYNTITVLSYSKNHDAWNAYDFMKKKEVEKTRMEKEYVKYYANLEEVIELIEAELSTANEAAERPK